MKWSLVGINQDLKVRSVEGPLSGHIPPILERVGASPGATNAVFRQQRERERQPWQMRTDRLSEPCPKGVHLPAGTTKHFLETGSPHGMATSDPHSTSICAFYELNVRSWYAAGHKNAGQVHGHNCRVLSSQDHH